MAINVSNRSVVPAASQAQPQSPQVTPVVSPEAATASQEPNMVSLGHEEISENEQDWAAASILRRRAFGQTEESTKSNRETSYAVQSPKGGWGAYGWAGKMIAAAQATGEKVISRQSAVVEENNGDPGAQLAARRAVARLPEAITPVGKGLDANGNYFWNEPSRIEPSVKVLSDPGADPQRSYSPRDWTPDGYQLPQPGTVRTDDLQVHQVAPGVWVDDNWNRATAPPPDMDLDGNPIERAYPVTGLPEGWTIEEGTGDVLDKNGQPLSPSRPVVLGSNVLGNAVLDPAAPIAYDPGPFVPGDWTYDPGTLDADGTFHTEPGTILDGSGTPLGKIPDGVSSGDWRSWLIDHPNYMAGWVPQPANPVLTAVQEDPIDYPELDNLGDGVIGRAIASVYLQALGQGMNSQLAGLVPSGPEQASPGPEAQVEAQEAEPQEGWSQRPVEPSVYERF